MKSSLPQNIYTSNSLSFGSQFKFHHRREAFPNFLPVVSWEICPGSRVLGPGSWPASVSSFQMQMDFLPGCLPLGLISWGQGEGRPLALNCLQRPGGA